MSRLGAFFAAIADDWIGRMSGGGGLLLTVIGFFVPAEWQRQGFLVLGVLCLFYASFRAWVAVDRQREDLLRKLSPRLEFFRQQDANPYFEEVPAPSGSKTRYVRIGLRNASGSDVSQARLVLEACEPGGSAGVHPEHELQPMGKVSGTLTFAVPAYGTVVVNVASESVGAGQQYGDLCLAYAQGVENRLPSLGDQRYRLRLRAEGGGPVVRCSLDLGGKLAWRLHMLA